MILLALLTSKLQIKCGVQAAAVSGEGFNVRVAQSELSLGFSQHSPLGFLSIGSIEAVKMMAQALMKWSGEWLLEVRVPRSWVHRRI